MRRSEGTTCDDDDGSGQPPDDEPPGGFKETMTSILAVFRVLAIPVGGFARLIAVGAKLVNTISSKVLWLDAFKVRLETRETLRELRS